MGTCASLRKASRCIGLPGPEALEYLHCATVTIHYKSSSRTVREKVAFTMPAPLVVSSTAIPFNQKQLWASACVLPGVDPRGQIKKPCQDLCFIETIGGSVLAGVYDGHGKEGHTVVACCRSFALNFYHHQQQMLRGSPERFLQELAIGSDAYLRSEELGINITYSGTTIVLALITDTQLLFANVGDSRAVLATSAEPISAPSAQPPRGEDKELMDRVKRRRSVSLDRPLIAVQMTKDHKPEDPEELKRITEAGGIVRRLMNPEGLNVGPWRVWQKETNHPGLAMSRSLGDIAGHEIGVSCNPTVSPYQRIAESDCFIVAGSDGIWDVLENQEVVDFIEAYRHSSLRGTKTPTEDKCTPTNTCIAQLLCEEARARWLFIVEEEDVLIDDISCVVLELRDSAVQYVLPPDRSSAPNMDGRDMEGVDYSSIPASEVRLRDPRRNSMNDDD